MMTACSLCRATALILLATFLSLTLTVPSRAGGASPGRGAKLRATHQVVVTNITDTNTLQLPREALPLVSIPTVSVGDTNNAATEAAEIAALGSVSQAFRISENEVTVAQYTAFLNSVAAVRTRANRSVVDSLYNRASMAAPKNVSGISRQGRGTGPSPFVYAPIGNGDHPMANVTWLNAARFANWMHNGATNGADTESGSYTLSSRTRDATGVARTLGAKWWIPTEDEWFKAAYYKGGSSNAGYHSFPTRSDSQSPGNSDPAATNQANYRVLNQNFCVTQTNAFDRGQNYLTPVGFFTNSPSAYGTFDQAGNVQEWTETEVFQRRRSARVLRGGSWQTNLETSRPREIFRANAAGRTSGFRLASAATIGTPGAGLTGNVFLSTGEGTQRRVSVPPGGNFAALFDPAVPVAVRAVAETIDPAAQGPQTNGSFAVTDTNSRIIRLTVQIIGNTITILPQ